MIISEKLKNWKKAESRYGDSWVACSTFMGAAAPVQLVFRAVNGYYKDANRKEDITISVCSDGKRYLKPKPSYSSNNVELACQVKISSLKGYEYEIWYHEKGGDLKIYAFNEQDIK